MSLSRLTIASLALNAGLVVFLLFASRDDSSTERPRPISPRGPGGQINDTLQGTDRQNRVSTADAGVMDWKERLRQGDIPRHVLIAAIQADFHAEWDRRDIDLRKQYADGKIEIEDLALFNLDREIALEATMRDALGEDAFGEWDRDRQLFNINTSILSLSDDEMYKLRSIRTALTDRLRALERSKLKKEINPATYEERYELAQADYERELKNLIGLQRFDETRDSGIPAYLRRNLRGLGISSDQLAQIQEIENAFGDGRAELQAAAQHGSIDSGKLDQEQDALTHLRDAQLQQTLGEEAYALYRKRQDPRYQTMTEFAKNWRLTEQDVENIFQLLHANETETRRIKLTDYAAGLPPEETGEKISALQAKLNESLRQTLSPEQAENLRRNGIIHP